MSRVWVTGAGGLIGSNVVKLLQGSNIECIAVYRPDRPISNNIRYIIKDLYKEALFDLGIDRSDVIVHCAAVIPKTFNDSESAYLVNRVIDDKIIEIGKSINAKIIYISSTSVYAHSNLPIDEDCPLDINNYYSKGKLESEERILELRSSNNIILRINAPYGIEQKANTVLKIFINNALNNEPLFFRGTGSRQQDFTAAIDVAGSVLSSINNDSAEVFNISGDNPISMVDLAHLVVNTIPDCTSVIRPSGEKDLQEDYRANFSIKKANRILGWHPKINLKEGIERWALNIKYCENRNPL